MHQSTLARKRDQEVLDVNKQDTEETLKPKFLQSASKKKRLNLNGTPVDDTSVSGVAMRSARKQTAQRAGKTVKIEADDAEVSKDQ